MSLQVSKASFSLMQEPRHEAILLQLQPYGWAVPIDRMSCIQTGQFVEGGFKCCYLKLNYNIA